MFDSLHLDYANTFLTRVK